MKYTILSVTQKDETIQTEVIYNFDGTEVTVDIAHFMPKTKEEVLQNIENRATSEQEKLSAINTNSSIVTDLETEKNKEVIIVAKIEQEII